MNTRHLQLYVCANYLKELVPPLYFPVLKKSKRIRGERENRSLPGSQTMHEDVVRKILEIEANRIVYVSCNPATQARDLSILDEKYFVEKVQPVDMFPHTYHVENVVLLKIRMQNQEFRIENNL